MDRAQIQAEWDKFIEYTSDDKRIVTTTSALLFAEHIAKLQATQEPVQAGELPEPDAVFYCSEDTGYLTQYRRPPVNLTDGDVAMYEADTVRSLLISAAISARKPLTDEQRLQVFRYAETRMVYDINLSWRNAVIDEVERAHGIGLEVKP